MHTCLHTSVLLQGKYIHLSSYPVYMSVLQVKCTHLSSSPVYMSVLLQVKCATPVFIPSVPQVGSLGMQHLWVCTSTPSLGQVSIVSLHSTRPALTESFKVCDSNILCVELVPGCGQETKAGRFLFSEDTVWMSNTHNE